MSYYERATFHRRAGMFFAAVVVIVWACMLGGCQVTPTHEFCQVAKPIIVHCNPQGCGIYDPDHDYITQGTADQILAHDETYSSLCK